VSKFETKIFNNELLFASSLVLLLIHAQLRGGDEKQMPFVMAAIRLRKRKRGIERVSTLSFDFQIGRRFEPSLGSPVPFSLPSVSRSFWEEGIHGGKRVHSLPYLSVTELSASVESQETK